MSSCGLIIDQICHHLLHIFSVNLGVILNKVFADVFCVMYGEDVCKRVLRKLQNKRQFFGEWNIRHSDRS